MGPKFYAVARGRSPGIYKTWNKCQAQTSGYSGPVFKSFKTHHEAQLFMQANSSSADASFAAASSVSAHQQNYDAAVDGGQQKSAGLSFPFNEHASVYPEKQTAVTPPNKGQKTTQIECEAFLREMELKSNDDNNDNLWETKPHGQLLRKLWHIGQGNMSFYTTTGTLLFQGRDWAHIKSKFYEWRMNRLKSFEEEYETISSGGDDVIEVESRQHPAKRQKLSKTDENNKPSIKSMKEELNSCGIRTEHHFFERSELEAALAAARVGRNDEKQEHAEQGHASASYGRTDDSYSSYSFPRQQNSWKDKPDEGKCDHCLYPTRKHRLYEQERMCLYSGKYQCGCGRWWWGMALKIQHKSPNDDGAFPPNTFPDCMKCKENYSVKLLEHKCKSTDDSTTRTGRVHQSDLCQLCKRGKYCPRATSY